MFVELAEAGGMSVGDLLVRAALRKPMVMPDTVTALGALERLRADELGPALVMG